MANFNLDAKVREIEGKQVKQLRKAGQVPAVLYGQGGEATHIQLDAKALDRTLRSAGTHQLIELNIEGQKKSHVAMARDVQRDILKQDLVHVDFFSVEMDQRVSARVPMKPVGVSGAVRDKAGILTKGVELLHIECLPSDLAPVIEVDISGLEEYNDAVLVRDINLGESVSVKSDPSSMVFKIEAPRKRDA